MGEGQVVINFAQLERAFYPIYPKLENAFFQIATHHPEDTADLRNVRGVWQSYSKDLKHALIREDIRAFFASETVREINNFVGQDEWDNPLYKERFRNFLRRRYSSP